MIAAQRKADAQRWMKDWVRGPAYDGQIEKERLGRFADIPRASFYRWWRVAKLQAAQDGAMELQLAATLLAAEEDRQTRKNERADTRKSIQTSARQIQASMPKPVTPDSILPLPRVSTIGLIQLSARNAMRVMAECEGAEGQLLDPKLFLQANSQLLACVSTQARVTELLYDAQRIDEMQQAMLDEVTAADPETAKRILKRFRSLMQRWGHADNVESTD